MDKIKKLILFRIPMSICNFRCHYCYLAQRDEHYQGIQPEMKFTPEQVRKAMSKERLGGPAYMNFCADGETLLVTNLDQYVKELVEEGHYAEIVSNMTINPMLDKILAWDRALLSHIEFKCSFHYLELKKKNLLNRFAENVNRAWEAGASVNIEVTPSDELIPYITKNKKVCHTLIISPPRCGKTTLLRDLIRQISDGNEYVKGCSVGVVDERSEIGGCYMGIVQNNLGMRTDVLDCCPKAEGMIMLIRSMSPQVVAVDEIGTAEDIHAIEYAMQCGCKLIASVHGMDMEEAARKPVLGEMIRRKMFERYIVLGNDGHPGKVKEIYDERGSVLCRK